MYREITTLLSPLLALGLGLLSMPLIVYASHKWRWFDRQDERKVHDGDIPRLGGIGIWFAFTLPLVVAWMIAPERFSFTFGESQVHIEYVLLGFTLIFAVGLRDDFVHVPALIKLSIQILAATIVAFGGVRIEILSIPISWESLHIGWVSYPLTVLWIVGLSNAVNLIDGVDGLAGGVSAMAALGYGLSALVIGNVTVAMISFTLLAALFGFLTFNFPPARLFMGDSGSLSLGFALSVIPLLAAETSASRTLFIILIPGTLLIIPILDTASAILRRIRRKLPIHSPDREHLHHKLLDLGLNVRSILALVYGFSVLLVGVAMLYVIMSRTLAFFVFCGIWALGIGIIGLLTRRYHQRHKHK